MHIATVEIEVIKMSREEEHSLWKEWSEHYKNGKDVFVCGYLMQGWDTDDGNNSLLLMRDEKPQYFHVSRL